MAAADVLQTDTYTHTVSYTVIFCCYYCYWYCYMAHGKPQDTPRKIRLREANELVEYVREGCPRPLCGVWEGRYTG